ncbi:MAG: putative zinc-binding metallopeptidase [Hyphomicrobiaceae bacterium]
MKTSVCSSCGSRIYFENIVCIRCGHDLAFDSAALDMRTLNPASGEEARTVLKDPSGTLYKYCENTLHGACNWLTRVDEGNGLCVACDMNRTIPDLSQTANLKAWQKFERAKKRLVYQLLRFRLPLDGSYIGKGRLTFDFARHTTTGHLDGVISVDVMEADSVWREQQRQIFSEPYRALLGHLRHESGHFYWMLLVEATGRLEEFRELFGDDREDYATALDRYHGQGPAADWQSRYVSAYADAHPWEDWAETWAHYLHMVDALDTAESWGLEPRASGLVFGSAWPFKSYDIYREETFEALMERWVPLTLALNSMSRSMGHFDFYPFIVSTPARIKLNFVHDVIRAHASGSFLK